MDRFIVHPITKPLEGEVEISGAKNAVLAQMAAAPRRRHIIQNHERLTSATQRQCPTCCASSMPHRRRKPRTRIDTHGANHLEAPYELVKTMRASFYVLGPLVARFGCCRVSSRRLRLGPRPVDLHLKGLEALGAKVNVTHGYVEALCDGRLPAENSTSISSVGATVNVRMAATLAQGTSVLEQCGDRARNRRPVDYLLGMGAKISGRGTRTSSEGVKELRPGNAPTIPDRIEAGTFSRARSSPTDMSRRRRCAPVTSERPRCIQGDGLQSHDRKRLG